VERRQRSRAPRRRARLVVTRALVLLGVVLASACGGESTRSSADLRACVAKRLPPGAVDRTVVSTVEGVTTIDYVHAGAETVVTVFPSVKDAEHGLEEEARIGDAHDERRKNVLYSGGGAIEAAVVACLS
jgi:hypothetical protein